MSISIDDLASAVIKELEAYDAKVTVATKKAVEKVAESCRKDIMLHAPKAPHSGKYAKSWKKKLSYYSANEARYTVYSTRYQLTHLLEYGHSMWVWGYYTGDRVNAIPHIGPAEARAENDLVKEIKRSIS